MSHTPGPWIVGGPYGDRYTEITVLGQAVAYVWTRKHDPSPENKAGATLPDETGEANALLIAAAPEMYEALRLLSPWKMRDGTRCFCPAGRDEDEPRGKMPTTHATGCEEARAAVTKATGGIR